MVCRVRLIPEGLLARDFQLSLLRLTGLLQSVDAEHATVATPTCADLVDAASTLVADVCGESGCEWCKIPAFMGTKSMLGDALGVALSAGNACEIISMLKKLAERGGEEFEAREMPAIPFVRLEFREYARAPFARKLHSRKALMLDASAQLLAVLGYCATMGYREAGVSRHLLVDDTMVLISRGNVHGFHKLLRLYNLIVYRKKLDPMVFYLLAAGEAASLACGDTPLILKMAVVTSSSRGVNLMSVEESPVPEIHRGLCEVGLVEPRDSLVKPLLALVASGDKDALSVAERFSRYYALGLVTRSTDSLLAALRVVSTPLYSRSELLAKNARNEPMDIACGTSSGGFMRLGEALKALARVVRETLEAMVESRVPAA